MTTLNMTAIDQYRAVMRQIEDVNATPLPTGLNYWPSYRKRQEQVNDLYQQSYVFWDRAYEDNLGADALRAYVELSPEQRQTCRAIYHALEGKPTATL